MQLGIRHQGFPRRARNITLPVMQVRQLECFRTLMLHGTMTRAAELLGISQPAVSNMIASLEHEIGFALSIPW